MGCAMFDRGVVCTDEDGRLGARAKRAGRSDEGREPTRRDETREILFARYVHVDVIVRLRCA